MHKSSLILAVALVALTGCAKTPKDKLQGKWLGEGIENAPAGQVAKANGWVKGTAIEFAGNKVTVTIPAETPRTGTFRVASVDGDKITLTFLRDEGGRDEAMFRMTDDKTLRWAVGPQAEVVMVKAQ